MSSAASEHKHLLVHKHWDYISHHAAGHSLPLDKRTLLSAVRWTWFLLLCERIILSDLAEASFTLLWYSNRNVFSCSKKSSTSCKINNKQTINLSNVWRTLKTLQKLWTVRHLDSGHQDAVSWLHHVLKEILQLLLLVLPSYTQLSESTGQRSPQQHGAGTQLLSSASVRTDHFSSGEPQGSTLDPLCFVIKHDITSAHRWSL